MAASDGDVALDMGPAPDSTAALVPGGEKGKRGACGGAPAWAVITTGVLSVISAVMIVLFLVERSTPAARVSPPRRAVALLAHTRTAAAGGHHPDHLPARPRGVRDGGGAGCGGGGVGEQAAPAVRGL